MTTEETANALLAHLQSLDRETLLNVAFRLTCFAVAAQTEAAMKRRAAEYEGPDLRALALADYEAMTSQAGRIS